jgi:tryptophanyl-tRNA synthetase
MAMRVLSGIQPSGSLHIGNYFAMMRRMIEFQKTDELFCFIVNFHALTTVHDPEALREGTLSAAMDFLALGLDPQRSYFWVQSDVPEVTELAWILSCLTPMGLLERCVSYKDKISQGISPTHGIFAYPMLMAADILAYQAQIIPVGQDQKQHLEVTRDIAIKFNTVYGDTFVIPEADIEEELAIVPGTDGQKMSKSYGNTIDIFANEKELRENIFSIKTDSATVQDKKDPEKSILYSIYRLFVSPDEAKWVAERFRAGGLSYAQVKKKLFEIIWEYFRPYRERRNEIGKDLEGVRQILRMGAQKARVIATETLKLVRERTGIHY